MALLLCYIHVSDTLPGQTATVNSFSGVSDKIKMFEMPIKRTGNYDAQLNANVKNTREIAVIEAKKKVSQLTSAFEKLHSTGNRTPSSSVTRPIAAPVIATAVAAPVARVPDISIARLSVSASSLAEAKPDPVTTQAKTTAGHKGAPSLLTPIKHQFAQFWSSIKSYISSLTDAFRQQQSEKIAHFENTARTKSEGCKSMTEIINAYDNSPSNALFLYNAAKQELIFNAISDIIDQAGKENKEIDLRKLCDQANRYAVNSGANARFFTLSKNNTIGHNIKYGVPIMQQRVSRVEEDIGSKNATSATLRRNSQSLSGRQRANSVQSITRRMVNDAYSKLFNDIHNDKRNIYGARHSFDRNEMRAALLEGQPALAGLSTSSAA
ncbi:MULTISPECIES: hypothetical protein [Pantoea]|uniref:hypothetical protein n=1 Tax=Pantoea TaxID=53335 RepID=UPI000DE4538C|nr:hypothetical protein [Pantoea sp. 3_1284]RBO14482.1 hypothetical protein DSL62_05685 [Pantoea sp. 3_1284]